MAYDDILAVTVNETFNVIPAAGTTVEDAIVENKSTPP